MATQKVVHAIWDDQRKYWSPIRSTFAEHATDVREAIKASDALFNAYLADHAIELGHTTPRFQVIQAADFDRP